MQRGRALDEVSAALADVQARQQRLALGSVLPRTSSPPPSLHTAPSPHPPPVSKDKALHTTSQFQWLKRRIVRRNEHQESGALEDLGSLDVVSSAPLAMVRTLIGQFIPLPARREFVFVHPMTNTLVDAEQEKTVFAREFPFICIELLPGKVAKPESAANIVAHRTAEPRRPRPETAHSLPEQQQIEHKKRPRTVETGTDQQAVPVAVSNVSNSEAEISVTKQEQITPVRTKRDRPAVLLPVQEGKTQTIEDTKGTSSVYVATMLGVKKTVPEAKFVSEHKRAISASLAAGSRTRIFANATGNEKKEGGVSQFRQTAKQGISSAGEVISLETHQQEDENSTVSEGVHEEVAETVKLSSSNEVLAQHDCLLDFGGEDAVATEIAVADDDIVADQGSFAGDPIPIPDALDSLRVDRPLNRKPGQLRRSRRFKALTAAKLAEKSWDTGELEQQEFLTDGNIEDFIGSFLEIVRTGLDGVGSHQVDEALLYYGIDSRVLELNQLLLALDSELSTRCNHVHGGVDGQLKQFLLKIFPVDGDSTMDAEGLQQFEYALNLFVGMRGWQYPTKLRARCFEERHPLQLIPTSDSRRLAMLRLTDRDRQLFALASSDNSTSRFENWLADGMEITYVLLYGFLLSRRNSGPKALAKLDTLHIRQERIQAAIQKLSSFSFDVWKRLEFRTTDLEATSMMRRLNELLNPFLRSNMYNGELVGSVFYPALVGYLTKKRDQLSQSLCALFEPSTNGVHGPLQATVLEFLRLLRQYLEQAESHSTTSNSYLQSMGLKIMDIDKINVSRSSTGLGRIYVNGNEAILTHHQCKLAARDRDLQLKARWDQPELSQGEVSRYSKLKVLMWLVIRLTLVCRYCFLGAKEIALEYVFLRMKIGISSGEDMSWEDQQAIAKMEARQAFTFLCSDSLVVPPNVAIGIGANVIHADLLPHLSSILSLGTVLREYAEATSVSFGYCSDSSGQNIRVMFRVHTLSSIGGHGYAKGAAGCWGLKSAFRGLDRFLASTQEEGAISFCEAGGLRFLNSYLHDRQHEWLSVKYGAPYFAHMYGAKGADMVCPRADILRMIKRAIAITPNAPYCITKTNIDIIVQLINVLQEAPDVADEAIDVLMAICSNDNPPELTESLTEYVACPMTDSQVCVCQGLIVL
ncbi:hypothetical protein P3T76_012653 [Phytophthora citrophthora]|uniref:Uncharacterized protein n=1 Tax=Phytophthora citrophthora TaxID=4793 RepID=A0AAD9G4P1_9STRA|nr:hypothetical protein P3T76_012653 [Phytophthora citrophthora]